MNKKAMFFTLTAIALLSLLAVSLTILSISHERISLTKRIGSLNDYVFSVEEDMVRKLFISGFRIIFLYEKRMFEQGEYVNNIDSLFEEAFFNGTINGTADADEQALLTGVLYSDIQDDIRTGAAKFNLNITLEQPNISVDQIDPWNVRVGLSIILYIEDISGLASWNRTGTFYAYIPIKNFEDPLYIINTNGVVTPKMRPTPYTTQTFTTGTNDTDITNLQYHLNQTYYHTNTDAPSFLGRLQGNFSQSPYGVESFVPIPNMTAAGFSINDKSIIDHIYFSTSDPSTNQVTGMPSWFKIDSAHQDNYNVTGLIT